MAEPAWLKTISNHAVITKAELLDWLGVRPAELKILMEGDHFPPPRFGGFYGKKETARISASCRWRVGDVRAWIEGGSRLERELATEIGAESGAYVKALRAAGVDPMGRGVRKVKVYP